jgi:exodeoxyribonuclease VII large subunit
LLDRHGERLDAQRARLGRATALLVERRQAGLERSAAKLRALSPLATLERGYAIVRHEGTVVRAAAALTPGDEIDVRVAEGSFTAEVQE